MQSKESVNYQIHNKMKLIITLAIIFTIGIYPQDKGIISGKVTDLETNQPVKDAVIQIIELKRETTSNEKGEFEFTEVQYGNYQIKVTCLGYKAFVKTDIVVLSARPSAVDIMLNPISYTTNTIDVEARYFQKSSDESTSMYNLHFAEIRRSPGAVEHIS